MHFWIELNRYIRRWTKNAYFKSEFTNVLIGLEHDSAIQSWYIWIFCPLSFQSVTTWKDWTNLCLNTSRSCTKCIYMKPQTMKPSSKQGKPSQCTCTLEHYHWFFVSLIWIFGVLLVLWSSAFCVMKF